MGLSTFSPSWRLRLMVLVCSFHFIATAAHAQNSSAWASVRRLPTNTPGYTDAFDIAVAADGSQYIVGFFAGVFELGGGITLTATIGQKNLFLAKYSATGAVLWATAMQAGSSDSSCKVAVDAAGNAYVAGHFENTLTVGTTTFTTSTTGNISGVTDAFLVKYNAQGVLQWARQGMAGRTGNTGTARLIGVSTDASGNVAIVGNFTTTIAFGGTPLAGTGSFYYRFSPAGALLLGRQVSTANAEDFALDAAGYAYITGTFDTPTAFGGTTLTSAGGWDGYLCKLDGAGTALWAQRIGGPDNDDAVAVAVDAAGNALVAGYEDATSGNGVSAWGTLYVARFSSQGLPGWSRQIVTMPWISSFGQRIDGVADDRQGGFYVAGELRGLATLGTAYIGGVNYVSFVARYDVQGTISWVGQSISYTANEYVLASSIVTDATGRAYLTGLVTGNTALTSDYATSGALPFGAGPPQSFVAEIAPSAVLTTRPATAGLALTVYPNPASGTATVALPVGGGQLTLLDALGRTVRRQALPATAGPCPVALAGLTPGLYQLRATLGNGQVANTRLQVE